MDLTCVSYVSVVAPNQIACRSTKPLQPSVKEKIAMFTHVPPAHVSLSRSTHELVATKLDDAMLSPFLIF